MKYTTLLFVLVTLGLACAARNLTEPSARQSLAHYELRAVNDTVLPYLLGVDAVNGAVHVVHGFLDLDTTSRRAREALAWQYVSQGQLVLHADTLLSIYDERGDTLFFYALDRRYAYWGVRLGDSAFVTTHQAHTLRYNLVAP